MTEDIQLHKEYFSFLCEAVIRVSEGGVTWGTIAQEYMEKFGQAISASAIRKRAKRAIEKEYGASEAVEEEETVDVTEESETETPSEEEETVPETYGTQEVSENKDGSISAVKTVLYTKEVFGNKQRLLEHLGFNPKEWQFAQNGLKYKYYDVRQKGKSETITLASVQFRVEPINRNNIPMEEYAKEAERIMMKMVSPCKVKIKQTEETLNPDMLMLMPSIEAHLGKLSHRIETGVDYDYKICSARVRECFDHMIRLQHDVKAATALVVIGGDFFNSEANGTTTAGTPQYSTDTRFIKMFGIGEELYCEGIMKLREHFDKVQVMLCAGNHAGAAEFCLYKALKAYFRNESDVEFSDNYRYTQSYVFGNSLLCFNHGDPDNKRLMHSIAAEFPEEWGKTKYRYLFVGHLHKLDVVDTDCGIQMHRVPAICEADAWHYKERFGIGTAPSHEIFAISKKKGIHLSQQITFGND